MNDSITVEKLSKLYRLGQAAQETMIREQIVSLLKNPFAKKAVQEEIIWALKDVSFSVKEGDVVGIVGRAGGSRPCWKSALAFMKNLREEKIST